jgi:hypothetical protein
LVIESSFDVMEEVVTCLLTDAADNILALDILGISLIVSSFYSLF